MKLSLPPAILAALLLGFGLFSARGEDLALSVTADRQQIYLGESVMLQVKVSGISNPPEPDLSAIRNCDVRLVDSRSQNSQQISIINGRMQRTSFQGRTFVYELKPLTATSFLAGPVTLQAEGRTLSATGPQISVVGTEPQEWVQIEIRASRESVLVDEPFDITLAVTLRQPAGGQPEIPPLHPDAPPHLDVPYINLQPQEGLETTDIREILGRYQVPPQQPGFTLNNFVNASDPINNFFRFGGDGFMQDQKARFSFQTQAVQRNGQPCVQHLLTLTFTPRAERTYTFGPATFKGRVIVSADPSGRVAVKSVFAVGAACTVRVVPPPEEGRPRTFIGAIGTNLQVTATLDTQTCKVGDPLTLKLDVGGDINKNTLTLPDLSAQPELSRDFRFYEDSVQATAKPRGKEYAYTVRPIRAGTLELPPIEVSYYDTRERVYKTVKTAPLPVRAEASAEIAGDDVLGPATNRVGSQEVVLKSSKPVPAPMDVNPEGAEPASLTGGRRLLPLLLAGPLLYLLVLAGKASRRVFRHMTAHRGQQKTLHDACRQLTEAAARAEQDPKAAAHQSAAAIRRYLAGQLEAPESALTESETDRLLTQKGIPADHAAALASILRRNFNAGYCEKPDVSHNLAQDCNEAVRLLTAIHPLLVQSARSQRKAGKGTGIVLPMALLLLSIHTAQAAQSSERAFLWREATAKMSAARSPRDFAAAVETYQKLADSGVRNSILFYNLGTACLMAEDYERAALYLQRAERYAGVNADIQHNLHLAQSKTQAADSSALPWDRYLLFWHYGLTCPTRSTLAALGFLGLWLALILRTLGFRAAASQVLAVSLVVAVLFGSSVAASLHQDSRDDVRALQLRKTHAPNP